MLRGYCILLAILQVGSLFGQVRLTTFVNAGKEQASNGFYLQNAGIAAFQKGQWKLQGAYQADFLGPFGQRISGTHLKISQTFQQFRVPFAWEGLCIYQPYSRTVHEINYAALAKFNFTYVYLSAGAHIRQYRISPNAQKKYGIANNNQRLTEPWNWIYQIRIQRFKEPHNWNMGLAISNIDQFLISPERSPMFYLFGRIRIRPRMDFYLESWHKFAGEYDPYLIYFGGFFRMGILWNIDSKHSFYYF